MADDSLLLFEDLLRQVAELDMLRSMYDETDLVLNISEEDFDNLRSIVENGEPPSDLTKLSKRRLIDLTIKALHCAPAFRKETTSIDPDAPFTVFLHLTMPKRYPSEAQLQWKIDAPSTLHKAEYNELLRVLNDTLTCYASCEQCVGLLEAAKQTLLELRTEAAEEAKAEAVALKQEEDPEVLLATQFAADGDQLGRRCVYYHHILSTMKRQCITRWAKVLRLNGFCKIGYPGLLLVEGPEENVAEYVRLLQRLRWKLMVVRGEETIDRPPNKSLDSLRVIPVTQGVIETVDSAEFGEWCKSAGLHELFLTGMRIYKG